jgi:hypothetical protein
MFNIFIPEIIDGRKNRVGGSLSQSAQSGVFNHMAEIPEAVDVVAGPFSLSDLIQYFIKSLIANPAG